jgi:Flp pilus assembly protein TadB
VRILTCAFAGIGVGWGVLGQTGLLLGGPAGVLLAVWVSRLEPAAARRDRERIQHDLPLVADLLAACSSVGCPVQDALPVASRAVGGPLGARLDEIATRLSLGADPATEWARVARDRELAELGRAVQRSVESGAPLADGLSRLAGDRRRQRRTQLQTRARSVGVKAAAPLALCFLPAFMLVGVVPIVAGGFASLFG